MAPDVHPACLDADDLLRDCDVQRTRGSGPGGQHRNKVETMVRIKHRATGVTAEAGERRRQSENRAAALFRLRVKLAVAVRSEAGAKSAPDDLWQSRCRGGRLAVNSGHDDFPALLAQALDVVAACDWDPKPAADRLGCTASQLVKFIKLEPAAFNQVNTMRAERDMHPLR